MRTFVTAFALLLGLCGHAANELTRNKVLVATLQKDPYGRERTVKFLPRGAEKTPIVISMPKKNQRGDFPILYVTLDGTPTAVAGLEVPHQFGEANFVIAGLPSSNRVRDYASPASSEELGKLDPDTKELLDLGQPKSPEFIKHLVQEVLPYLEREYGPFSTKVLLGGSFGGIAVLETLLTFPDAFDGYGVISPSLWYNYKYYEDKLDALAQRADLLRNKCMFMTASEDEQSIFANSRKFDRLLRGYTFAQTFLYQYKRLTELSHAQAIRVGTQMVAPFVFNIDDILSSDELTGISLSEFQDKLGVALKAKTCLSHPTMDLTRGLFSKFGESLVQEKRYNDAFAIYKRINQERPHHVLQQTDTSAFIWKAFPNLLKEQKDAIAKDYLNGYSQELKANPAGFIHAINTGLEKYIAENKIGVLP